MIEPGVGAQVVQGAAGAGLGVEGAEDEAVQPGEDRRPGAHRARLEGDDEGGLVEAPGAERLGGVSEGEDLGVRGRVLAHLTFVVTLGDDLAADEDDGSDQARRRARRQPPPRESESHGFGVGHAGSVEPGRDWRTAGDPLESSSERVRDTASRSRRSWVTSTSVPSQLASARFQLLDGRKVEMVRRLVQQRGSSFPGP